MRADVDVLVRDNVIEDVRRHRSAPAHREETFVDASGATVLPGLIDAHTHIFLWGEKPEKGGYDANILRAGLALRAVVRGRMFEWTTTRRRTPR